MSKRRRHQAKGTEAPQIEWLKHRTGYPSPEDREKIIRLRQELVSKIIGLAASHAGGDDPRLQELITRYGTDEVMRAEKIVRESLDLPSRVADDAKSYRDYRLRYSRFGAGLPFYTAIELEKMFERYAKTFQDTLEDTDETGITETEEVEKNLLIDWREWEDITPPAIPPRPDVYNAPAPGTYPASIAELLEWGIDLEKQFNFADEQEHLQWKKFIPAITRMALDHGLLNGWPSENASWAPWHAIHTLGNLQAWESIPALAELADIENDWLSDHLPHIWSDMGIEAEPMLWMILEDHSLSAKRRGLAAEALFMLTDDNEAIEYKVVKGFEKLLQNARMFNSTLNAYLISFLQSMEAVDDIYLTVEEAFEQGRVDPDIITPEDLAEEDFEDDDWDDEDSD